MKNLLGVLKSAWAGGSGGQRGLAVLSVLVVLSGIGAATWLATRPDQALLFGNLEPSDAAAVLEKVRGSGAVAEVRNGGRDVYVARAQVSELRMLVSADGLPRGGGRGWELFDTSNFGVSDFVQNVNYRRALQGALERDIGSFDAIEGASVNITTPHRSPFVGEAQEPKASVMVRVRSGRSLTAQNVQAITHLVAGAVEGLDHADVRVVDTAGRVLSEGSEDALAAAADGQLELRTKYEQTLRDKAQAQLDRMGVRADVRVAVELDFQQVRETAELYAADGTVLSETVDSRSLKPGSTSQGGPAGTKPKVEGETFPAVTDGAEESQETITTSYAPSRTVRSTDLGGPRVTRLSVGLVVDKAQEAQLAHIEELVKRAVGFDPSRNDSITTVAHEFPAPAEAPVVEESGFAALAPMLLERGIQLLGILGALFLVLKVLKLVTTASQGKSAAQEAAERAAAAEKEAAERAAAEAAAKAAEEPDDETLQDPQELQDLVRSTVEGNKSTATRVLRQWLAEGSSN